MPRWEPSVRDTLSLKSAKAVFKSMEKPWYQSWQLGSTTAAAKELNRRAERAAFETECEATGRFVDSKSGLWSNLKAASHDFDLTQTTDESDREERRVSGGYWGGSYKPRFPCVGGVGSAGASKSQSREPGR